MRLHKPKAGWAIRFCVLVIYPLTGLLFRLRYRHLERIPATGGVIIAINHISIVDPCVMARLIWQAGRLPRFLIKSGLFEIPGLGRIVRSAKQIPVYRGTSAAADSVHAAAAALDQGEAVVIYPEGTISRDPEQWPMQARTGIARLVLLRPDVPVVPIGQWGAQRRQHRRPARHTACATVGEPLDLTEYRGRAADADTLREITDRIMTAVCAQVAEVRGGTPPTAFYRPPRRYARLHPAD